MKYYSACFLLPLALATGCAQNASAPVLQAPIAVQEASAPVLSPVPDAGRAAMSAGAIHLEAEKAALTGTTVQTKIPGYRGTGYAGEFQTDGAKAVWEIPQAHGGLYQATIRYAAPYGTKGYDLVVNGARLSGMFAATKSAWAEQPAGQVELHDGANTVSIEKGWGYYDIDALDLSPAAAAPPLKAPPLVLSDAKATPQARALLRTITGFYGAKTLSGQYSTADTQYIQAAAGKTPAIMGGDLMDYSPSRIAHGSDPKNESERVIQAAKGGQIATLSWHWNSPTGLIDKKELVVDGKTVDASWYKGFNTSATTFDLQRALADPHSADYALLLRDMDAIAVQLKKFSDAGVPLLWRPLHEAEGGWFWWGAKGPEPFKQLWRLMHDRLTNVDHLHNLIWVYSSGTKPEWYPGDAYVDVVGIDGYPADVSDPLSSNWETLLKEYGGRKLIALTEFGGVPDIEKMGRYGIRWAYFVSWTGGQGPHKMTPDVLARIYNAPIVVTKDGLPPSATAFASGQTKTSR